MPITRRNKSTIGLKIGGKRVTGKGIRKKVRKVLSTPMKQRIDRINKEIERQGG